eukprot:TRINITY_DN5604_c0_g2_i1.p1 TRINITY_DN5604_c0_g2~~TRINITY_DN5604_c0_g2_i1.p1  ORF type:complete len:365 (-),score=38.20 TRINITY_DN5604_c0_g2_i1:128-1222(-)
MADLPVALAWSATLAMLLSFFFAGFLFLRCVVYLRKNRNRIGGRRDLVKHIAAIAGADACMAAWCYISSVSETQSLLVQGDPSWCAGFSTVRMWLILVSALCTAALAVGTLVALLGKPFHVRFFRYTSIWVFPLSMVMCSYNLVEEFHMELSNDGSMDCYTTDTSAWIECIEQASILVLILFVLVYAWIRAARLPHTSPERRCIRTVSRYLVAYIASYGAWIVGRCPLLKATLDDSRYWHVFVNVSWRLLNLNGAFNFLALWLHARDSLRELSLQPVHVAVDDPDVSVVEVSQIDYGRMSRRAKADTALIQTANQRRWAELGLTYEQGVSGQVEPLSEEERATHFYSILNGSCGLRRLEQAIVT